MLIVFLAKLLKTSLLINKRNKKTKINKKSLKKYQLWSKGL